MYVSFTINAHELKLSMDFIGKIIDITRNA